jgi:hypothetical protein
VRAKNEEALVELVRILSRDMRTAVQISVEMRCSRAVAYDRLRALRERGVVLQRVKVRDGVMGPKSFAYAVIGGSL